MEDIDRELLGEEEEEGKEKGVFVRRSGEVVDTQRDQEYLKEDRTHRKKHLNGTADFVERLAAKQENEFQKKAISLKEKLQQGKYDEIRLDKQ